MSLPAVSKHLKVLEHAGLITRSREAQWRPCRIEPRALKEIDDWLEHYRRFYDESFDRLDDYLKKLQAKEPQAKRPKGKAPTPGVRSMAAKVVSTSKAIRARWSERASSAHRAISCLRHSPIQAFGAMVGPNGFTTTTLSFDMRPGGVWRFVMHGPDGRDYQNRITYEEVVPPERLVYRHAVAKTSSRCSSGRRSRSRISAAARASSGAATSRQRLSAIVSSRNTAPIRA